MQLFNHATVQPCNRSIVQSLAVSRMTVQWYKALRCSSRLVQLLFNRSTTI